MRTLVLIVASMLTACGPVTSPVSHLLGTANVVPPEASCASAATYQILIDPKPNTDYAKGCVCGAGDVPSGSGVFSVASTSRSRLCFADGGQCSVFVGNVACSSGQHRNVWTLDYEDTRECTCACSDNTMPQCLLKGEFMPGIIVTTCCN